MPTYTRLTDRSVVSGLSVTDIFHVVVTGDTSQSPQGSSYYAPLSFLQPLFSGSSTTTVQTGTNNTFYPTFVNSNNLTPSVENFYTESGLTFNPNTEILNVGSKVRVGSSTPVSPSFSFVNDTQSGMFLVSTFNLGFSTKSLITGIFDSDQNFYLGNGDLASGANFLFKKGVYYQTTNNVPQDVSPVTLQTDCIITVHAYVAGGQDTGAAAIGGDIKGTFINNGGVVTQVGVTLSNVQETFGGANFDFVIAGTTVKVRLTGLLSTNINWGVKLFYISQSYSI